MRTLTTINWVREQAITASGELLLTTHSGNRGSWTFQISTRPKGLPKLVARDIEGRTVSQEHRSLRAAKAAALDLLHPAERMGWNGETGQIQYRAQWDNLVFVVFDTAADTMAFQWRDTEGGDRTNPDGKSQAVPVSGIREARELAAAVLRDRYPTETPADVPQAADGALIGRLANALALAGIPFTDEQLVKAADALV